VVQATTTDTTTADRHVFPNPMTPPPRIRARIEGHVAEERLSCGDPEVWPEL
jgi:hypothetical protein